MTSVGATEAGWLVEWSDYPEDSEGPKLSMVGVGTTQSRMNFRSLGTDSAVQNIRLSAVHSPDSNGQSILAPGPCSVALVGGFRRS